MEKTNWHVLTQADVDKIEKLTAAVLATDSPRTTVMVMLSGELTARFKLMRHVGAQKVIKTGRALGVSIELLYRLMGVHADNFEEDQGVHFGPRDVPHFIVDRPNGHRFATAVMGGVVRTYSVYGYLLSMTDDMLLSNIPGYVDRLAWAIERQLPDGHKDKRTEEPSYEAYAVPAFPVNL